LKLHDSKCVLFATKVKFCERLITKEEVRLDPKNMRALQTMQEQQNGADLVQFQYVTAVNWMRSAIPNYSKRVAPLQAVLAKVFEGKCRRTKKTAAAVSLLHLWRPEEQVSFKDLQSAIIESMTLAFADPRQEDLCLDGCLRSLLCWLGDTDTRGAAVSSNGRARPPASCVFFRRVQRRASTIDSTREERFCYYRYSDQGGLPVAKS
jgi:hypothetical protein